MTIDWDAFKSFKHEQIDHKAKDNFTLLYDFIKSYYNMTSYFDIYDLLRQDALSIMMLQKRQIDSAEALERFFKR